MIAGALTNKVTVTSDSVNEPKLLSVHAKLRSNSFDPLSQSPYDVKNEHKDNHITLIQQTVTDDSPQSIACCQESGMVCISWAHINNVDELQSTLQLENRFTGNNSTLILASYKRWLDDCPQFIRGDFTFAIYDPERQKLFLARDRIGVRPLYYCNDKLCFLFASNPAVIARLDEIDNQSSRKWMTQYIFKHICDDSTTAYKNIKKLPPGHVLTIDTSSNHHKPKLENYWSLDSLLSIPTINRTSENWVEEYRRVFDCAVRRFNRDAQPIGIEVSGGLDSSSILSSLIAQDPDLDLHGFSRAYFALDLEPMRDLYARFPNVKKHIWDNPAKSHEGYLESLQRYIQLFGMPDEHSLAVGCSNILEAAANNGIKTIISGYGGDEFSSAMAREISQILFEQKQYYGAFKRLQGNPIRKLRQFYRLRGRAKVGQFYDPPFLHPDTEEYIDTKERQHEYLCGLQTETSHNHKLIKKWRIAGVLRLESHTLAAAARGLSFHWPFLDEDLLSCYFQTPITERFGIGGQVRWLHRRAFQHDLPSVITNKNDKYIGALINECDPHEVFMRRFPKEIDWHQELRTLVNTDEVDEFLRCPTEDQKNIAVHRNTFKSIFSLNTWLSEYFN